MVQMGIRTWDLVGRWGLSRGSGSVVEPVGRNQNAVAVQWTFLAAPMLPCMYGPPLCYSASDAPFQQQHWQESVSRQKQELEQQQSMEPLSCNQNAGTPSARANEDCQ